MSKHIPNKPFIFKYWKRYLDSFFKSKKDRLLLDIGCGPGFFLRYAEKASETVGIDLPPQKLSKIARKVSSHSSFAVASAECLPFRSEAFHAVTAFAVLEHTKEPVKVLDEVYRVVREEGVFIFSVPNMDSVGRRLKGKKWTGYRDPSHRSVLQRHEWIKLCVSPGFRLIDTRHSGLYDTPYPIHMPAALQRLLIKIPSLILAVRLRLPPNLGEEMFIVLTK